MTASAAVHDVAADFSLTNNPSGVWTYGYMNSGEFNHTNDDFLTTSASDGFVAYDMVGGGGGDGQGWTTGFGFPFAGVWSVPPTVASVATFPGLTDFPSAAGDNPSYPHGVIGGHPPNCTFCSGWYAVKYTAPVNETVNFDIKAWQTAPYPTVPPNPTFGGATRGMQTLIQKQSGSTYTDLLRSPLVSRHGVTNLTGTPQYTAANAPTPGNPGSFATQQDEINAAMRSSARPNVYRLTNVSLNAGESLIISYASNFAENFVGFLGFDANVTTGADRVATKRWDLADNWSTVGSTATNIGPDGAWSYGILRNGSFAPYDTIKFGNVAEDVGTTARENHGWGTQEPGWFTSEALNVATGPIFPGMMKDSDGINNLTGGLSAGNFTQPPTGDWGGGKVVLHTPDATVDAAKTSDIRWTAPRNMTVNATGGLWRATLPDDMDRRHQYLLKKNGTTIASGTVNELNFNCGAGGNNSACPANFAANNVSVLAGDKLDLQISPLSIPGAAPGDYNGNGITDAADYTVWRDHLGQSVTPGTGADGDGSGMVDAGDYTFWQNNFGATSGAGSSATPSFIGVDFTVIDTAPGSAAAVPEPGTLSLLLVGAGLASATWRKNRTSQCREG